MDVFLVRHAEAVDDTADRHRPLTAQGRVQAAQLGDRLRWHDCAPTHVWTSPLVRAVQTAELLVRSIGEPLTVETLPALAPNEPVQAIVQALAAIVGDARVVIVGHEPTLSTLAGLLARRDVTGLAKAEAIWVSDGRLRWRFAWNADAPTIAT